MGKGVFLGVSHAPYHEAMGAAFPNFFGDCLPMAIHRISSKVTKFSIVRHAGQACFQGVSHSPIPWQ